jgi:hypothetical protein
MGKNKITINDDGICPNTIAATATYLSLCDLTIPFQAACKKAAKITAKNTFMSIVKF